MTNATNGSLLENSRVKIGAVIAALILACGFVAEEVAFKVSMHFRLQAIEASLSQIERTLREDREKGWSKEAMRVWVAETKAKNANWHGAAVE